MSVTATALAAARVDVQRLCATAANPPPADFVEHYLQAISDEVLAARSPAALAALIGQHAALAAVRRDEQPALAITPPAAAIFS